MTEPLNPGMLEQYINYAREWYGPVPRESRWDTTKIDSISLPFTPEEWCSLAMRDGEDYMGGCCGNLSALQDYVNAAFRDSGHIGGHEFLEIALIAKEHDGFEEFKVGLTQEKYDEALTRWEKMHPWQKMALLYHATKTKLHPQRYEHDLNSNRKDNIENCFDTLQVGLSFLRYSDMFARGEDDSKQKHAGRLVQLARIMPAAKKTIDLLSANIEVFEGVAIVEVGTDRVLTNSFGMCLYDSAAKAGEIIELWCRNDKNRETIPNEEPQKPTRELVEIRPIRVTVEKGLEFTGGACVAS